ncbi:hypothetical protein [Risungbinella massiliensis]|uniref:hypothetical protein n=1 Tax=Risungbinella massiliensis TaxID=1329796 RepID=UPI0005CC26D3|nr:hypothetical protein [Risungbinella massiliensis]
MDWRRAKTILIVTFLLLNLYLASQLNDTVYNQSLYVNNNLISDDQINNLLKANQVQLDPQKKPRNIEKVNLWKGQIETFPSHVRVEDSLFEVNATIPPGTEKATATAIKSAIQTVYSGELSYTGRREGDTYYFNQMIGEIPIYSNPLEATYSNGKIKVKGVLFVPVDNGEPIPLIPVNNALYTLINNKDPKTFIDKQIDSIQLVYWLSSDDPAYLVPYWRFQIGDSSHLVNAHKSDSSTELITEN